jgi:hypothetical protein
MGPAERLTVPPIDRWFYAGRRKQPDEEILRCRVANKALRRVVSHEKPHLRLGFGRPTRDRGCVNRPLSHGRFLISPATIVEHGLVVQSFG